MKASLFLALLVCASVYSQLTTKFVIDDFGNGAGSQAAEVELTQDLEEGSTPIVDVSPENYGSCSGLVGCGRDMEMRVFSGLQNREFVSQILSASLSGFEGEWVISNPKTSSSIATIEYDGQDGEFDGEPNGDDLGGVDITAGGTGTTFRISAIADLETSYDIFFFDSDGNVCELEIDVPEIVGDYDVEDTIVDFNLDVFDDDCDLTEIDYIRVSVASDDAVDAIIRTLSIVGPPNPSESPSRSVNPTASNTPSRTPTPTRTQTPTPTPSERAPCVCECPLFRCGLIFDVPHDDDDNNDDDNNDDDDLVFVPVYARPFDDDFEHAYPDDDENEAFSFRGGLTVDHNDDDDESSDASALAASAVVALVALI